MMYNNGVAISSNHAFQSTVLSPPYVEKTPTAPANPKLLMPLRNAWGGPGDGREGALDLPHANPPGGEPTTGNLICEFCGAIVSAHDDGGDYTTAHIIAHLLGCPDFPQNTTFSGRQRPKRTKEQRIEIFRSDPYVLRYEPGRVCCRICGRWRQLSTRSTYYTAGWIAHRAQCLKNQGARVKKAAELSRKVVKRAKDKGMLRNGLRRTEPHDGRQGVIRQESTQVNRHDQIRSGQGNITPVCQVTPSSSPPHRWTQDQGIDSDGDYCSEKDRPASPSIPHNQAEHSTSNGRADLTSNSGRTAFVFSSVDLLLRTTYGPSDDLRVSVLLEYLNSAFPPDKYEEFGTLEVIKAAVAMQRKGRVLYEGDMLRPVGIRMDSGDIGQLASDPADQL